MSLPSLSLNPDTQSDLLWTPSDPSQTQTSLFREHINSTYSLSLQTYQDLYEWSISHRADFWSSLWDFQNVVGCKGKHIVDEGASPENNPSWLEESRSNWAENQLRHSHSYPNDIAIIQLSESSSNYTAPEKKITQLELYKLVGRAQRSLIGEGIQKGDRIGYWGGNVLEAVVLVLASSSIGAIFSSAASDFGVDGVKERLDQIKPKLLFVTNGVIYNGVIRPLIPLLPKLLKSLKSPPEKVVVIEHLPEDLVGIPKELDKWDEWLDSEDGETTFERLGFNDPIWILFSSGTTGKPKAIVHRQGGMLLDSLREHHLAGDIGRGDVFFYYTTPGWMMFQYLVSSLSTGATIILYEGSPLKDPSYLFNMIDQYGITIFGTSAKWLEVISKTYPDVKDHHELSTLKQILSTGSPLPGGLFDWIYEKVKKDVLVGSITGGTDICSVFAGRNTSLPIYRGEIQSRMLGFALDTDGPPNQPGELICKQAFPIEPLGFWPLDGYGFSEDEVESAKKRFKESYFKGDKGIWYHGDYVRITPSRSSNSGGILMLGRSDGVLNPGGIRFGPTDIYSVLEGSEYSQLGVEETLVVGLMVEGGADEKVVLFVKMKGNRTLDDTLIKKIKTDIRLARSARHVPSKIIQVSDIPVTLTNKRVEVPIRKLINGASISSINPATLRNPDCLEEYVKLGERMRKEEGMDG
ncbi:acetoacetate-CoA ligase [Kwoniella mangroviensis CBS 8507]|uniref:acetoacetate-CoA ligase n=1 Tax=Kwoniella mangroviensis CBS 8507 TaxID=1296122 RepID=UPI00080D43F9|nr:acetoacetate-CoA ligase [Kwoniella mangroviensis CBS 8507]OCF70264.1 acetoacetate-CoA ligase [Kwoniella mangroviensis CBS 8507]